jgi:hypothetical protein
LSGFAKFLHVGKVLKPPYGEFVLNQVLSRNDVRRSLAIEEFLNPIFPRIIEGYACNTLQYVYSARLNTQLEDGSRLVIEIRRGHPVEGSPILRESGEDSVAVLHIGLDENIEVFGATGLGVNADGVATDDKILHVVGVECG